MQSEMLAAENAQASMSPGVVRGTGADKIIFRLACTTLDANPMAERVTRSPQLPQVLQSSEKQNFRNIVTGDESCFFLDTSDIWVIAVQRDLPSRPKQNIKEKCLVSIIWSPYILHGRPAVPKGDHSNSTFFANVSVPDLHRTLYLGVRPKIAECWTVHLNMTAPHSPKHSRTAFMAIGGVRGPRSAIRPGDFYLFDSLKEKFTFKKSRYGRAKTQGDFSRLKHVDDPFIYSSLQIPLIVARGAI
jgi:hypothetical protein